MSKLLSMTPFGEILFYSDFFMSNLEIWLINLQETKLKINFNDAYHLKYHDQP